MNCRVVGGFNHQFIFQLPPACSKKLPWGQGNPPEQHSIAQCILLSACIKRFPTRVSFRMIRSSEAMTVLWIIYLFTYLPQSMLHMPKFYFCTSMPNTPLCICVCIL